MPVPQRILEQLKKLVPPLDGSLHKGQAGRVGVLGGALDYTGAPYFAAISALKFGSDLSHVICAPTAAGAIKSYSPDLIVHPILGEDKAPGTVHKEIESLLSRLHVIVLGPGLGREKYMQDYARVALDIAREKQMFVVLDADALWMVGKDLSAIKGYQRAVLTPNVVEFSRLSEQVGIDPKIAHDKRASLVSRALGGVTVLQKGSNDIVAVDLTHEKKRKDEIGAGTDDGSGEVVKVDVEGGLKRCGGQGDVLSGSVGAMLAWGKNYEDGVFGDKSVPVSHIPLLAAVGASMVTRTASRKAFKKEGRSVVTENMIPEIGESFAEVFEADLNKTKGNCNY